MGCRVLQSGYQLRVRSPRGKHCFNHNQQQLFSKLCFHLKIALRGEKATKFQHNGNKRCPKREMKKTVPQKNLLKTSHQKEPLKLLVSDFIIHIPKQETDHFVNVT